MHRQVLGRPQVTPGGKGTWGRIKRVGSVDDWRQSLSVKARRFA